MATHVRSSIYEIGSWTVSYLFDIMNVYFLGLIIICSILGIATGKLGEAGRPFVVFFKATSDIIIMVLTWFVW